MYGSGYRVERCAGDGGVDVDEAEQTAQTDEREDDGLLEVDGVVVAAELDDDALRHGCGQLVAESVQQERVVKAAAGCQQTQRSRVRRRRTLRRHGTSDLM